MNFIMINTFIPNRIEVILFSNNKIKTIFQIKIKIIIIKIIINIIIIKIKIVIKIIKSIWNKKINKKLYIFNKLNLKLST